jgi:hypothetical protein
MEVEPLVVVPIVVEPIVVLEPMVVVKRRTPTRRRRPVPLHPPTRQLRALAKTAAAGADVTWNHYEPFVQPAATHDANGVALRRSCRRAAHEGNVKRVFRTNAYNAVAE